MAQVMKRWSWRNHGLVCGVLLVLTAALGVLDGWLGLRGLVAVPSMLLLGITVTCSTAMVAARRPPADGVGRIYGAAALAALLMLAGVLGTARLVSVLSQQERQQQNTVLAADVVLAAFSVQDMAARVTLSLSSPAQLQHVTVMSQDGYCQGIVWPESGSSAGEVVVSVPLRCAGNVAAASGWRLSTIAQLGEGVVTLIWADSGALVPADAVLRPLP